MELNEQIAGFQEFLEANYKAELLERVRKGDFFMPVDFNLLGGFNPELAELLLESPEEVLKAASKAVADMELPKKVNDFSLRFYNLPKSNRLMIRNLRSKHIEKLIQLKGIVRQKSDVRPQVVSARFECPSCGNILGVLQLETKFREPTRCGCGRKGKFILVSKELVDAQKIVIEECPDELEGGEQPKRLNIFLKNDLVSPISDKKTNPGSRVEVVGYLKEVPIVLQGGGKSVRFDLMLESNYIAPVEEDFTQINLTEEEKKEIIELSKKENIYAMIRDSLIPSIYGHDIVKEAIMLQLFGGVKKEREDGAVLRGDVHILLIGDPGAGKSQMLQRVMNVAPKARFVSGKGASGAGLTATVVKDEFLRGWALEAGALVLANRGMCCIDELDKMSPEDRSAFHEALEQQTVTIAKANINATLKCETVVLAAANPKFGRFDPYELIAKQIDLPSTLINRFDLIFPIRDMPSREKDEELASFILKLHKNKKTKDVPIDTELLRKYIAYAKQNIKPVLGEEALLEIRKFYVDMRNSYSDSEIPVIPLNARQLEALVRLAEASAKVRLSGVVEKEDAEKAISLVKYCLTNIGMDPKTGKIDIDRISTGIPASQRATIHIVKEIINELYKGESVEMKEILEAAKERGLKESEVEETIEKLRRAGDIYSPKPGYISKT